ncbi:MAG: NAD-dependent epimerase/dehydratase family protein [Nitrospirota bacterium]
MSEVRYLTTRMRDRLAKSVRVQSPQATPSRRAGPVIGMSETFRTGACDEVEQVLHDLKALGVTELRAPVSWAHWQTPAGEEWYNWLIPRLTQEVQVLPCLVQTPPSLGVLPKTSAPPRDPRSFADFVEAFLTRFDKFLEYVELWNEPDKVYNWDWRLDPEWRIFSEMIGSAAYRAQQYGKKAVLGATCPTDPHWLRLLCERGILSYIDVVGFHGFPGTWEFDWDEWSFKVSELRDVLDTYSLDKELWITETGFSTWKHDELGQLREFIKAAEAPAARVYWASVRDLPPDLPGPEGMHTDERCYHLGLRQSDGRPKLLFRLWQSGGIDAVRETFRLTLPPVPAPEHRLQPVLIIGGAGFIGTNLAHRLLATEQPVLIYDNLSRPGVERNLRWLREAHGDLVRVEIADICNRAALREALRGARQVFHFGAQVAVTTSLVNPDYDFTVNVCGTMNLLEELRRLESPPPLVFTSTNKVYGGLEDIYLRKYGARYEPIDFLTRLSGINERCMLDFQSPYGCSKGTADQYILDYARTYGIPATVFRMSCIYGPHQLGTEDQGWVAHFLISAIKGRPITIYGDGMQVRDVLYVEDLVDALLIAQANIRLLSGQAFNIGGGPANTLSLLELVEMVAGLHGARPEVHFDEWRHGDQRYYVSDARKFKTMTGWTPRTSVHQGVAKLYEWLTLLRASSPILLQEKEPHEVLIDQS